MKKTTLICQGCGFPWNISTHWFKLKYKNRNLTCPICGDGKFRKKRFVGSTKGEKNEMWKKYLASQYPTFRKRSFDEDEAKKFMEVREKLNRDKEKLVPKKNKKFRKWARKVI